MKIFSSSPYATFNSKEWKEATQSRSLIHPSNPAKLKKNYYKHVMKFKSKDVLRKNINEPKSIQLSFA